LLQTGQIREAQIDLAHFFALRKLQNFLRIHLSSLKAHRVRRAPPIEPRTAQAALRFARDPPSAQGAARTTN
jgi:hypothetical protein